MYNPYGPDEAFLALKAWLSERMRRKRHVIALACMLSALLYLLSATTASPTVSAHAFVVGSDPVDGTTISGAPQMVRIYFNAPISSASVARLYGVEQGNFVEMATGRSSVSTGNARELDTPVVNPGTLPQGSYEVKWTAISTDDGHTTYGLIGFNVGFSSNGLSGIPTLGPSSSNTISARDLNLTAVLAVAWDWFVLAALTLWIGILLIERVIVTGLARAQELLDRTKKQALALQWLCLAALLAGELVTLLLRCIHLTQAQGGGGLDPATLPQILFQTNYGHIWIVRIILLALALGLLGWTQRNYREMPESGQRVSRTPTRDALVPAGVISTQTTLSHAATSLTNSSKEQPDPVSVPTRPAQSYSTVWLGLAASLLLTYAFTDNAALVQQPHITSLVLEWLHLLAQSAWFGGLVYLGYLLLPLLPAAELDHHTDLLMTFLHRLAPCIAIGMGITVIYDLFSTEMTITDPALLLSDPYGRTLFVQLALTLVLIPLSLLALFALPRKLTHQVAILPVVNSELPARRARHSALERTAQGLKQSTRTLSLLAAAILLCSALLSFFAPPIVFPDITYSNPVDTSSQVSTQTQHVGDLAVTLYLLPARVGVNNTVVITIADNTGKAVTNAQVQITINMVIMDMGTVKGTINSNDSAYVANYPFNATFDMPGVWKIDLRIQRPGHSPVTGSFQVNIAEMK